MTSDVKEIMQEVESTNYENNDYQVEGYAICETAKRECQHDCLGTIFWSSFN